MTLFRVVLFGAVLASLSACGGTPVNKAKLIEAPHYWERSSASSAIYTRGPKAQQMLDRDIARCVTELRELERLGEIRAVIPGNTSVVPGTAPDPHTPAGALAQYDTPSRDGYLYNEFQNYHDFETCMLAKGWERIDHVPYDVAKEARETYILALTGQHDRSKSGERVYTKPSVKSEWGDLNE